MILMLLEKISPMTKYCIIKKAIKSKNVAETCELYGISRTTYYKWYRAYKKSGMEGLLDIKRSTPMMPNKVDKETEKAILKHVEKNPCDGPKRICYELFNEGYTVGESGIYNVLKRNGLSTRKLWEQYAKPLLVKKQCTPKNKIDFNFKSKSNCHAGYLVMQGIYYLGSVGNIDKVYQYVIYDSYSKWGYAKLFSSKSTVNVIEFMNEKIDPLLELFDLKIDNIITNGSAEFSTSWKNGKHIYEEFLMEHGIKHTVFSTDNSKAFEPLKEFLSVLTDEFYKDILSSNESFTINDLNEKLYDYLKNYLFKRKIKSGVNKDKTPSEVVLSFASKLDAMPLWLLTRTD